MIKITYFVHGTTLDNERGLSTGALPGELSELGVQQSKDLPGQLADSSFEVVFCSSLQRSIDSATISFGETHKIIVDDRLGEANYGDFNGQPDSFKEDMFKYVDSPFPSGESYRDVEKRIASFIEMLKRDYVGKHVAIVAHEAPQLALEVILKGKTWQEAIAENWRKIGKWQPGWIYEVKEES